MVQSVRNGAERQECRLLPTVDGYKFTVRGGGGSRFQPRTVMRSHWQRRRLQVAGRVWQ
jgi:hypothetical protein